MSHTASHRSAPCQAHLVEDLYASPPRMAGEWAGMLRRIALGQGMAVGCMQGSARLPWHVQSQSPPTFSIAVVLDGHLRAAFDGGTPLDLLPGTVAVMSTGTSIAGLNRFAGHAGFKMVDIRLTPEALRQLTGSGVMALRGKLAHDGSLPGANAHMGCAPAPCPLVRVAADLLDCGLHEGAARGPYLQAKALQALALMLEALATGADAGPLAHPDSRRLMQARALMEGDCGRDWTLPRLSRAVGLNEKRLQAGFQHLFGQSVHACLTHIRMEAAARLLAQGHSVTETALATGFSSLSHFSKVFRQAKGLGPRVWARGGHLA